MTEKRAYRPKEFCQVFNISLSKFYDEVNAGRIPVKKIGRVSLVSAEAATSWFNSQPDYAAGVAA